MKDLNTLIELLRPSHDRPGALYKQISKSLISAIQTGLLKTGDCLMAERDLAQHLEVSRVTLRKAISELVEQGHLLQRQGAGTMVCESPTLHSSLSSVNGFTEDMQKRGLKPTSKLISQQQRQANQYEAQKLDLKPNDLVCQLIRVRLLDNIPLAYEIALIPVTLIPASMKINASLYSVLSQQNMEPIRAIQSIRAKNATEHIAKELNIYNGDAVLYMERQGFAQNGCIVEYTQSYYRGDRYDYTVELK